MKQARHTTPWQRKAVAVAVASCFVAASPAYANPMGATVVSGTVSMSQQGNALDITNSPGAIINWQSFSIGTTEITRFLQQSAASSVLNRVTGQDPSSILGQLQSNGQVFLINPNGVLFGAGAQVDVAGLVVSTLNLSDADFLGGRHNFTANTGAGGIDNQGSLNASGGGQIYLVAPDIKNSGAITSANGDILLAAGNSVELVNANTPDVRVVIAAPDNQVLNLGSIVANSGRVGIFAGLINHHGIVSADTATVDATGKVTLHATRDINLEAGSVISASGTPGGVHDGGEIRIVADGTLNMRQGSQVHVDGGVDGGDGGFLELSGLTGLALRGAYTGRALKAGYHNGSLLLDPMNILIDSGGSTLSSAGTGTYSNTASSGSSSSVLNINKNMSGLTGWSTVSLTAGRDITLAAPLTDGDLAAGVALALNAGRDINLNAAIGTSGARFNHDLTLTASSHVNFRADIYMANNTLTANAGNSITVTPLGVNQSVTVDVQSAIVFGASGGVDIQGGTASGNLNAYAKVHGGTVTINAGNVMIQGGSATASVSDGGSDVVDASAELRADTTLSITTTTGGLTVQGGSAYAKASCCSSSQTARATADAQLISGGNMTLDIANGMTVQGGSAGASAYYYSNSPNLSQALATADALVSAGGTLGLTVQAGGLQVLGGGSSSTARVYAYAYWGSNQVANASANATIEALGTGGMTIDVTGGMTVLGGSNASATASSGNLDARPNIATVNANALVSAPNGLLDLTVQSGGLKVQGGSSAFASASDSGHNEAIVSALAAITAKSMQLDITGGITVAGGDNAYALALWGSSSYLTDNTAKVDASAKIEATGGNITLDIQSPDSSSYALLIRGGDSAGAEASEAYGTQTVETKSNAGMTASGGITIHVLGGGNIEVAGGDNAYTSISASSSAARITALIESKAELWAKGGALTIDGTADGLTVRGGYNARANTFDGSGSSNVLDVTIHADAQLKSSGAMTLTVGSLSVQGGSASAYINTSGSNKAEVTANALIDAASLKIDTTGSVQVQGGNAYAFAASSSGNQTKAEAKAAITVAGTLEITNGASGLASSVSIAGGSARAYAYDSGPSARSTPDADADVSATMTAGTLTLRADGLSIQGGNAHAEAGGCSDGCITATNRSAEATATGLLSVSTVSELTLGSNGMNISAGSGSNLVATAIVNGAGGVNTALSNHSAYFTVSGDVVSLTSSGGITIQGGHAQASADGTAGTNTATEYANAGFIVGGSLTLDATNLNVYGGSAGSSGGARTSGGGNNGALAQADAALTVGGTLTGTLSGGVNVEGYDALAEGYDGGTTIAYSRGDIYAGDLTLTASDLNVYGGSAYAATSSAGSALADAGASVASGTPSGVGGLSITTTSGDVQLFGGSGFAIGTNALAAANAKLFSYGPIDLTIAGNLVLNAIYGGTDIIPDYNTPDSPITVTFTGSGGISALVPGSLNDFYDAVIESLYTAALPPAVQVAINGTVDSVDEAVTDADAFEGTGEETGDSGGEENGDDSALKKKKTYTCQ